MKIKILKKDKDKLNKKFYPCKSVFVQFFPSLNFVRLCLPNLYIYNIFTPFKTVRQTLLVKISMKLAKF